MDRITRSEIILHLFKKKKKKKKPWRTRDYYTNHIDLNKKSRSIDTKLKIIKQWLRNKN
jgi:hypothetical protein